MLRPNKSKMILMKVGQSVCICLWVRKYLRPTVFTVSLPVGECGHSSLSPLIRRPCALPPSLSPGTQTLLKLSFHFFFCYHIGFLPVTPVCFCSRHPTFVLSSSVSSVVSHSQRIPPVSHTYIYLCNFAVLSHTASPHLTLHLYCCFFFISAFPLLLADSRMKTKFEKKRGRRRIKCYKRN